MSHDDSLHHLGQQLPHTTAEGLSKYPAQYHMKTSYDVISSTLYMKFPLKVYRLNHRDTEVSH